MGIGNDANHEHGPAERLGRKVFDELAGTICTHPCGADPKPVIVFSPHPDDDVISMGGTLIRLVKQKHDVHIAYMTSGNIAVFDHDALRHIDYVNEYLRLFGLTTDASFTTRISYASVFITHGPSPGGALPAAP